MRRVVFRDRAVADIAGITAYIPGDKPRAVVEVEEQLHAAARSLEHFPDGGGPVGATIRQLATVWPYPVRHRVLRDGTVVILTVRHGARGR